jgi:hypothetical protein
MTHGMDNEAPTTKGALCAALQHQFKVPGPPLQVRQDTDESLGEECLSGFLAKYFSDVYARTLDIHGEPNANKLKAVLADFGLEAATGKNSMVLNCHRLSTFARSHLQPPPRPDRKRIVREANANLYNGNIARHLTQQQQRPVSAASSRSSPLSAATAATAARPSSRPPPAFMHDM